jgi:hypothetical protein
VLGGKAKTVDEKAALAVKGVRQVVNIDEAVAVVADHIGAAKKGLEAAAISCQLQALCAAGPMDQANRMMLGSGRLPPRPKSCRTTDGPPARRACCWKHSQSPAARFRTISDGISNRRN